jgi:DNA-binding CsgD family transcriptional regulator
MTDDGLIDKIYEAAVVTDRWPDLLESMAMSLGGTGGILMARDEGGVQWLASPAGDRVYQKLLAQGWAETDNRIPQLVAKRHAGFLTDGHIVGAEQTDRLPLYAELLKPEGFHAAAATVMRMDKTDLVMTVEGFSSQAHAHAALPALDRLRPHLARAAMLSAQFGLERARNAVVALGQVGLPSAMLGHKRRLLATNGFFDTYMDRYYTETPYGFRLADIVADQALGGLLFSLSGPAALGSDQNGGSLIIRGPASLPKMVLHVIPVRGTARDIFTGATAILTASIPGRSNVPGSALIQSLLNLTPAEARLARALASGLALDEASRAAGILPNTGRTHLKRIFAKTGISRQSDLISLLVSVAPPAGP